MQPNHLFQTLLVTISFVTLTLAQYISSLEDILASTPTCALTCSRSMIPSFVRASGCRSTSDWSCLCRNYQTIESEITNGSTERGRALATYSVCAVLECGAGAKETMDAAAALVPVDLKCLDMIKNGGRTSTPTSTTTTSGTSKSDSAEANVDSEDDLKSGAERASSVALWLLAGMVLSVVGLSSSF